MIKIKVDDQELEVSPNSTVISVCEQAGATIPRFCYHEKLSVAGNCRMCLVEIKGMPKPIASCAMSIKDIPPSRDGSIIEIKTQSETVQKARHGVMEFLLINHPLDCPICDQGGECDLQEQSVHYGLASNRYYLSKRAVSNKDVGPLVRTIMNRCIHCTRCIRFSAEIAGTSELGAIGRGENMEITTYLEESMTSELSANVIDICPVGALTSKPYSSSYRSWEFNKTNSIDLTDAVGSNIEINSISNKVIRIIPRQNDNINDVWISDKARFIVDGLNNNRIDAPYIRKEGKLTPVSWKEAIEYFVFQWQQVDKRKIAAISGDMASLEEILALKTFLENNQVYNFECRPKNYYIPTEYGRSAYLFPTSINNISDADAILIIGCNPRLEAPIVNLKIRQNWISNNTPIAFIGSLPKHLPDNDSLRYDYKNLGKGTEAILNLINENEKEFSDKLKKAQNAQIIIGIEALKDENAKEIYKNILLLAQKFKIKAENINFIAPNSGLINGIELGFFNKEKQNSNYIFDEIEENKLEMVLLLGEDNLVKSKNTKTIIVYMGSHGCTSAMNADIIFPTPAFSEKNGTYFNIEGRPQIGMQAVTPPGKSKDTIEIVSEINQKLTTQLINENDIQRKLQEILPETKNIDSISIDDKDTRMLMEIMKSNIEVSKLKSDIIFNNHIADFYLTGSLAKSSPTMAKCSQKIKELEENRKS